MGGKILSPEERIGYPFQYSWASPGGSEGKESAWNAGDLGLIPGLGRSPGEGKGYHSCILAWVAKELDTTEPLLPLQTDYAKALTVWITTNWKFFQEMKLPDLLPAS